MNNNTKEKSMFGTIVIFAIIAFVVVGLPMLTQMAENKIGLFRDKTLNILSSYENKNFEGALVEHAKDNGYSVNLTYMGDLDMVEELNKNSVLYDGVWISNSIWLYMLENTYLTSDSKSISISPVVMGVKKKKAEELGLVDKSITNQDILNLINNKQIKYVMSSVTQTNTGATAYLGFLNALAGSPEVLSEEMLDNETLTQNMINLFSGVERVSGDEEYLENMFINGTDYEAIITSESSLININSQLSENDKLYLLYPSDGVPINDSTFAFIKNDENKEEYFLDLQKYLLSKEGQEKLQAKGRRTWYGGVSTKADKKIFNPSYGIDTTKYLITSKYPSKAVMTKAINLYIEEFRKPTHVVFCLDYSGSMYGTGIMELQEAMNYILNYEEASKDKLQFSKKDIITVIPFSTRVIDTWQTKNGLETQNLIFNINNTNPNGSTALYNAIMEGIDILDQTSSDYTKTIIAMTDGAVNVGSFMSLQTKYNSSESRVPVYSITFGDSNEQQLEEIARLTNAKVFDGKSGLLQAFKEVRGYN